MDPDTQLRNLRDFLLVYNRMTEICFQRCSSNFNYRTLTMDEERCVDSCAGKLIRTNHRLMATYMQLMPRMMQRRMEEMESKAAANVSVAPVTPEATGAVTSSPSPPVPPVLPLAAADFTPTQTAAVPAQTAEQSAASPAKSGSGEVHHLKAQS
ncbi:mitochondrial import inner membrane translocase subunit Tim10 B [Thalassophryne amazonica]|uniref:mitochondrial import inner membrane translocase subunit Tim10 B n=1 Tax=Thalassophryne amazonica TaxID=390379 RepID=UPI00147224E0|nr:mitochondrial import inner membrane translocase subunit Tim10 B [Thalassophryne amazonica]